MVRLTFLFMVLSFLALSAYADWPDDCIFYDNRTDQYFDVSALTNPDGDYVRGGVLDNTRHYVFNFCKYTLQRPCDTTYNTLAYREKIEGIYDCQIISNVNTLQMTAESMVSRLHGFTTNVTQMVQLTQESKYKCFWSQEKFAIRYVIICDPNVNRVTSQDFTVEDDNCRPTIVVKHRAGCFSTQQSEFQALAKDPLQLINYALTDNPNTFYLQGMLTVVSGMALIGFGQSIRQHIVDVFFAYSGFILSYAYLFEFFRLSPGISLVLSLGVAALLAITYRKLLKGKVLALFGMVLGMNLALFLIFIFDLTNPFVVYVSIVLSALMGGAAYFKTDEFFAYFSQATGAILMVQGLTVFLADQFPTFIEGIQEFLEGDFSNGIALGAYIALSMLVFALGVKKQLSPEKVEQEEGVKPAIELQEYARDSSA